MIDRMASGWLNFVVNHPRWVLACVVLVLMAAVAGLPKLRLDASSDSLTLERDTDLDYFREVSQLYDSCLLYTSPSPRDKRQSRMPSSA